MNFFNKSNIIIWVLAGLLVITLAILGTVAWNTWYGTCRQAFMGSAPAPGRFLSSELDLTKEQKESIASIRSWYQEESRSLRDQLQNMRIELMSELQKDSPDSSRVSSIASEIGRLQGGLTRMAAAQYLRIRNICTPEQQDKLSDIYLEIFGCPKGSCNPPGRQMQHRYRHGQGR